ncbi:Alkaline phosphatase D precursor [Bacillus sp. THAF10]|uniref:alkaline phosphatase D family protein n=1 Tax=Bacillus sp. THAF10 TaxID=2587848 RepID=UPI001268E4A1|nr:alkaline phosphatase D family protein [Bacillus sp. THAF10]QFT87573.1 Alkaline phosphatase D precursor [Bacillus sp. THAF10]
MRDDKRLENEKYDSSKRTFLKYFLAGSAVVALETTGIGRLTSFVSKAQAAEGVSPYKSVYPVGEGFPQSVASGDPTSSGMMLWTRIDPAKEEGFSTKEITSDVIYYLENPSEANDESLTESIEQGKFIMFEVSTTKDFSNVELKGFSPIWKDHDNVVRIDLDGQLAANKTYYYRFVTKKGYVSKTGTCKTLPEENSQVSSAKIGYISCQDYTNGYFSALGHMAEEDMTFFIHLGDYIYESVGDAAYQGNLKDRQIKLPSGQAKAFTKEDYRKLYQTYRGDKDLQKLHERHGMVATWDDHEFANDTYYPAIAPDDNLESDPTRRLIANQVWFEYMPARVPYDGTKSFEESIKIYRAVTIGNLANILLTDERLYRSSHPCGQETLDRYISGGCAGINSSSRTMLGKTQRDWFLNELKNASGTWKIWGNEVQVTQLKLLNRYANLDAWDGYAYERDVISQTIMNEKIKNFIALTGDFHTFEASYMQYKYEKDSEKYGVELMVGSVTSSNLRETLRNALNQAPDTSGPIPIEAADELINLVKGRLGEGAALTAEVLFKEIQQIVKADNPWIQLFDSTTHGYALLELTNAKATWTAYSVDNIEKPQSKKSLLWQCEVPNGEVKINVTQGQGLVPQ